MASNEEEQNYATNFPDNSYKELSNAIENFTDNSEDFAIVEDFDKIEKGKMYVVKDKEAKMFYGVYVRKHSGDKLTYLIVFEKSTDPGSKWEVTEHSAVELGNKSSNVTEPLVTIEEEELHKDYIFYSIPGMSGGKRKRRSKSKKTNKRKTKRRRSTRRRR
jgi:hypothetical protein